MTSSFDFDEVDRFICGTVGPPGGRTFYLQAVAGSMVVTLKLEKQQVALLADYLARVVTLHELPDGPPQAPGDLLQPIIPEWIVGELMVAVNEATGRVIVIAREIEEDSDDFGDEPSGNPHGDDRPWNGGELRVALSRHQVDAFVATANELMAGGRPACRLCGRPIDPQGHACPRWN